MELSENNRKIEGQLDSPDGLPALEKIVENGAIDISELQSAINPNSIIGSYAIAYEFSTLTKRAMPLTITPDYPQSDVPDKILELDVDEYSTEINSESSESSDEMNKEDITLLNCRLLSEIKTEIHGEALDVQEEEMDLLKVELNRFVYDVIYNAQAIKEFPCDTLKRQIKAFTKKKTSISKSDIKRAVFKTCPKLSQ